MEETERCIQGFGGEPVGKLKNRQENNSKLILRKLIAAWTDLAQVMDMMDLCECNNVPLGTI